MTKRQLIDTIVEMNPTARPAFLAQFGDEDLNEYLEHLRMAARPRPTQARSGWASEGRRAPAGGMGRPVAPSRPVETVAPRPVRAEPTPQEPVAPATPDDEPAIGQYVPTPRPAAVEPEPQITAAPAQPIDETPAETAATGLQETFLF